MGKITTDIKTLITNSAVLRPFACAAFFLRGFLMYYSYCAGISKKAREGLKAINNYSGFEEKKTLKQLASIDPYPIKDYIDSMNEKTVKLIKPAQDVPCGEYPVLLCVVYNDLERIKVQIEYHRKIGVRHFAYIDNMSSDGTAGWLGAQSDVSYFTVGGRFNNIRKAAWKKQAAGILGHGHWYLSLDPDELFMYPGIEEKTISDYVGYLEEKNIEAGLAMLVDMYPEGTVFSDAYTDFVKDFCFFDTDSYQMYNGFASRFIYGGPRPRVFGYTPQLAKYPLVKMSKQRIMDAHMVHPWDVNHKAKRVIAFLLHYKTFSTVDMDKMASIAESGVYVGGSEEYRMFIDTYKRNPKTIFYSSKSKKLNTSTDLLDICLADRKFFAGFSASHGL